MIADASRFRDVEELDCEELAAGRHVQTRSSRAGGGRELSGQAKLARSARHSRGHGGRAKLFNGAHLKRQNRHVAW